MNVYKNKYTFILLLFSLISFGCDNPLKEDTSGVLVQDSYYKTTGDLKAGITGIFGSLLDGYDHIGSARLMMVPGMGDDIISTRSGSNKGPFREIDRFKVTTTNHTVLDNWRVFYRGIYAANSVLANYQSVNGPEEDINRLAGVAHFMRAYFYFNLIKRFGDVPLLTSPEPDYEASRAPVSDVYKLILDDLKFAEDNLPSQWDNPQFPTKWATKAYLSRVYITMAGWPLKDEAKYSLARDKAKEVMDSGRYQLMENFGDFFQIENNNNAETIFALQFCATCGYPNGNHLTGNPHSPPEENGWVDVYGELNFFKEFPEGPRKDATFLTVFNDSTHWQNGQMGHPFIKKWRSGTTHAGDGPNPVSSNRVIPIVRYAHILTLYAEAQDMADGGPNSQAYAAINKIRKRAGLPNLTPGLSKIAFRDSVLQERSWEFAGEFVRWYDLVRSEKVAEANADKSPNDLQPQRDISSLPEKDYYYLPIPQTEISLNSNLEQNPGYN